jgi:hypothetical protein
MGSLTPRSLKARGYRGDNPYQREHEDLMASIRGEGPYLCDAEYGATSSMTAVMGRMATYSGQVVAWEDAIKSEVRLGPQRYALDADAPTRPDAAGNYPSPSPGLNNGRAF